MINTADAKFDHAAFLDTVPSQPGVYRMLDDAGNVLYVGKARDLKKRVASYFRGRPQDASQPSKSQILVSHIRAMEVTVTHTETEALLLENNLIKALNPRYNILLRDDKSYPYIYVSTREEFPRLTFHRGTRSEAGRYFGPFPSAGAVRETLHLLQKLFRVRQCEDSFFRNRSRPCLQYQIDRCTAPCVGLVDKATYGIDVRHTLLFLDGKDQEIIENLVARMEAAAKSLAYEAAAHYRDRIRNLRQIQEHQYVSSQKNSDRNEGGIRRDIDIVAAVCRDGVAAVQVFFIRAGRNLGNKTFFPQHAAQADAGEVLTAFLPQFYLSTHRDAALPDQILVNEPIHDVSPLEAALGERAGRKVTITLPQRGERTRWLLMAIQNAELAISRRLVERSTLDERFETLREILDLEETPTRIECFDVSHTQGESPVASCVVFGANGSMKNDYRRFNLRDIEPGDDYAGLRQALRRRYTRLRKEEAKLPELLLVDGGKGQLTQAIAVLTELQIEGMEIVAVAKGPTRKPGLETLFLPHREMPLTLPADSAALHLIQQIRDEAHRFAIAGHRSRRSRARNTSTLEQIPGVGAKRRRQLLNELGGLQGIQRAGVEDLARVRGISPSLARAIYGAFHE
uniref:UvrABC system protein C n=1 Tax=Candidatus Kentrum sp. LPFa TaxID=2126335 RepID=A0A450WY02_9GAMM|nr:MAG: Excinuclease ABC subunit C [Candidatus Kentron sp. LPFa]VFK35060.1 MAG: Excinuclease ABC subunit C [Candidatus Kentron sp. LPFa]